MGPAFAAKFAEIVVPQLLDMCHAWGARVGAGEIEYQDAYDAVWEHATSRGAYYLPVEPERGIDEVLDLEVWISDEILVASLEAEKQIPPPPPGFGFLRELGRAVARGFLPRPRAEAAVVLQFATGERDLNVAMARLNLEIVSNG